MPETLECVLAAIACDLQAGTARVRNRMVTADSPQALRRGLVAALYDELHAGRETPAFQHRRLRDAGLEAGYAAALPRPWLRLQTPVHAIDEDNGRILIERDGVRTWSDWDGPPLRSGERSAVLVQAARPALSPGFFLADSTQGPPADGPILRVYVHLTEADPAAAVWASALTLLERQQVRFRAKICSVPALFPRRDALVVYLDAAGGAAGTVAADLAAALTGRPGTGDSTSAFAHRLQPGVAVGWEPEDRRPGMLGLSFGEHRAAAIAAGVIEASGSGRPAREPVLAALADARIDPAALWRNVDSPHPPE